MPHYKFNPKSQQSQAPGNRSSFVSSAVPKDKQWEPAVNRYTIRLMPPWSEEGVIAKKIMVYYNKGNDQLTFISPDQFEEDTCPFVHAYKQIRSKIRGDKGGYERHKPDIDMCRPAARWYANVVVMDEVSKGVQLWGFGVKAYEQIMNLFDSMEYGDLADPDEGSNLLVTFSEGTFGLVPIVVPVRNASPIVNPQWLDQLYDLDNIWLKPDLEAVKKAYLSSQFSVWTPEYLYADEVSHFDAPLHTPEIHSYKPETKLVISGNTEDVGMRYHEVDDTMVQTGTITSKVDEVTGAPLIKPDEVMPPTPSNETYQSAVELEAKVRAKIAASAASIADIINEA